MDPRNDPSSTTLLARIPRLVRRGIVSIDESRIKMDESHAFAEVDQPLTRREIHASVDHQRADVGDFSTRTRPATLQTPTEELGCELGFNELVAASCNFSQLIQAYGSSVL